MAGIRLLAWLALIGWTCGSVYWHVCRIKQLCDVAPTAVALTTDESFTIPPLNIADSPDLALASPQNVGFVYSRAEADLEAVRPQLDSLVTYLKAHRGRTLTLTGYYAAAETNPTTYPNLGVARAESLRAYLTEQGVPAEQVQTAGELVPTLAFHPRDSTTYGLNYTFAGPAPKLDSTGAASTAAPKAQTEAGLAAAEKYAGVFKPMNLYFPSAQATYIRTPDNQRFFEEAKAYLAAHPGQKLKLTGHTDNEGDAADNLSLSKQRAQAVQRQFEKRGIPAAQLLTEGRGEAEPVASNQTPAGRKANRRVTIVVQ